MSEVTHSEDVVHTSNIHVLTTSAPRNSLADAEGIVRRYYGLEVKAKELTSERDQNFLVEEADGTRHVLKFTNPAEAREVTNFQTEAMVHLTEVDPDLPVPRITPSVDGEVEVLVDLGYDQPWLARLISFLPGVPLAEAPQRTAEQRRNMGRALARLDLALRGFFHPAAGHELLWDLKHASRLHDLLPHIADSDRRALATRFLTAYETHAQPVMPRLRAQVIHNDLNTTNVMVGGDDFDQITGILDFGDMVHAPLINDLGVALAYQLDDEEDPLNGACEFVAAYHELLPLEAQELDVLFDLLTTRLVMTVAITEWRAARYPENRDYILRHNPLSWAGLERLAHLTREQAQSRLRHACGME